MKRLLMTLACSLFWLTPAQAQTCFGALPFTNAPLQAGALVGFSSSTRNILAGVAHGNEKWFVRGALDVNAVSGYDSAGKGLAVSGGMEFPVGQEKRVFACPMVEITKTWGPNFDSDTSESALLLTFGGNVGFEASMSGTTRIIPTAGLNFTHYHDAFSFDTGFGTFNETANTTVVTLHAGVGLLFNDKISLVPTLMIPLNQHEAQLNFAVFFTTKIR